jgi:acetyl esterase/lipase
MLSSTLVSALVCVSCCSAGLAQESAVPARDSAVDAWLGISTIPLWDGEPSSANGLSPADSPSLTVFVPQSGKGNGTAVVIAPGGAYINLASNLEGRQVADWFAARGITAFILKYRLGPKNPYPVPLLDAQRAIRLVRSLAMKYGIAPQRVGMVGFSAGGHLAAAAATLFDPDNSQSADPVDRLSDRPDFLVLGYPWLNAMQPNDRKLITYCAMVHPISPEDCRAFEQKYTPALHVTSRTPPAFIYSTSDDGLVPAQASVDFYTALNAAGVSAELHVFRHGGHGSGLGAGDPALDQWPVLLEAWLRGQGLLEVDAATASRAATVTPTR